MRQQTVTAVSSATATPPPPTPDLDEDAAPAVASHGSEQHGVTDEATQVSDVDQAPPQNTIEETEQCEQCKSMRDEMKSMRAEMNRLFEENVTLRKELSAMKMDEEFFNEGEEKARDEKVRYYTGLPYWTLLQALHSVISPCLTEALQTVSFPNAPPDSDAAETASAPKAPYIPLLDKSHNSV